MARPRLRLGILCALPALLLAVSLVSPAQQIKLEPGGYFETPGFAFLIYQNDYIVGKRGGLEMFLHGRRVLDAGEVVCLGARGTPYAFDSTQIGERTVEPEKGTCILPGKIIPLDISYQIVARTDGQSVLLTTELGKPLDPKTVSSLALKLEIYPREYVGKTYRGGEAAGYFPDRYMGKTLLVPAARELFIAAEDGLRAFTLSSDDVDLRLVDGRATASHAGFTVLASLPASSRQQAFTVKITPRIDPEWRSRPVIQVSQVGYHPGQKKAAVIELDSRTEEVEEVKVFLLDPSGRKKLVKSGRPVEWGPLFSGRCFKFDFTEVTTPGLYFLSYGRQEAGPVTIAESVYDEAWKPTLDVFFPVQMCHVEVREGEQVWHGACHLDDALQAPPGQLHFDSYRQAGATETPFKPNEHVPGLDWGGWHDAGDFDLPSGSIAQTLLWMALAREEFGAPRDVTSIDRAERRVSLFVPDGKDDLLQQVSFGMEFLLNLYQAAGHVCPGVIENNIADYALVGDPVNITDGLVFDPGLKPGQKSGGRSGTFDDRWVFTNRNTGGQYQFVQVAAACSRALRGFDNELAERCLKAAREVWDSEQMRTPVNFEVGYQPQEDACHSWEMAAAAELFLTTGEEEYKSRLLTLSSSLERMPAGRFVKVAGFTLVRALSRLEDVEFAAAVAAKSREVQAELEKEFAGSPYGVTFDFEIWGNNWKVLDLGARLYFFIKQYPDLFPAEYLYAAVNYCFGCHPATNHSYVSGVGVNSATIGYGFNRAEWTYIPGGVVSGASFLRPKFIEYRSNAWDWYETEYVIGGSAAFVFDVLAARSLLAGETAKRTR
jgi:endoglucanase